MNTQLPDSEFQNRIERIQEKLNENDYDAYLVHCNEADQANVRYLSDHWPIFETAGVMVPKEGDPILLIGPEAEPFAQDRSRTALLFSRGIKYIYLSLFPISLIIVTLASEGLDLWLGAEFAKNSTLVLQWLTVGVFINSLAQVAFALVQGAGRPDLTAKLHLIELPFYLLAVWWLIGAYGIEGAAIAWVARIGVDTIFLFGMAQRFLPTKALIIRRKVLAMAAALFALALASLQASLVIKGLFLLFTLAVFSLAAWFLILGPDERVMIGNRLKTIQLPNCM